MSSSPRAAHTLVASLVAFAIASGVMAQQRRVIGKVKDQQGINLEGVSVTAKSPDDTTFHADKKTDKNGEFTILLIGGAIARLHVELVKEGFITSGGTFPVPNRSAHRLEFVMEDRAKLEAADAAKAEAEAAKSENRAIDIHNEGVAAAQTGDWAGAATKFEEALTLNSEMVATHEGLATAAWNIKDYPRAEKHARRAIELGAEDAIKQLLADALAAQGKEAEAAAMDPVLRAQMAYNAGAELNNANKTAEAFAKFAEAAEADPTLALAHYYAGSLALGLGKMPESKTYLAKYLELEPAGKHAETAKAMISVIK